VNSETITIRDDASGATAKILVSQGFNCFSWRPVLDDGPREMLWSEPGFENGDKRPSGSGIPLLFPFPGRIGGARYQFDGTDYALQPGDAFGNAIHGFVYTRPWRVVERSGPRVVGEFHASVDDASILEHWPADFRIRVSYEVRGRELVSDIRYENTGTGRLPCGFGTHAYFRLPLSDAGKAADTEVMVPVDRFWPLEQMIPTGERAPVAADLQLAAGLRLGEQKFDTCFTGLKQDADGLVRTRLTDPASRRRLTQTFDASFTQCVIYTPPHREAICLEPYTCVPDAIRLASEGQETGLQILQHGEMRKATVRIEVS
jgi:aldose 1-epimerase